MTAALAEAHPRTVAEAAARWRDAGQDTVLVAGGTGLLAFASREMAGSSASVVSLRQVGGSFREIAENDGRLVIGAGVSLSVLAGDRGARAPGAPVPDVVREAAATIAFPNIRRAATLGGNLVNGVLPSQMFPALFAADADIIVSTGNGDRALTLGPGAPSGAGVVPAAGEAPRGWLTLPHRAVIAEVRIPADVLKRPQSLVKAARSHRRLFVAAATHDPATGLRTSLLTPRGLWCWSRPSTGRGLTPADAAELADMFADEIGADTTEDRAERLLQRALLRRALKRLCPEEGGNPGA
jgi:CO/xanthine dehydrogenase FAD-binding subunit